jgi:hypothetical protein
MELRQEKAPLTQHALTVRALALGSAAVAGLVVTGVALRRLLARLVRK